MTGNSNTVPILIIGCGFGGIALAIALKKAGIDDFTILERASDVGGVWRDNTYPGAACDVVSRLYSLSGDQDYAWSRPFAPQGEILNYINGVVDRHGIRPHVRFETEVTHAAFDEAAGLWRVETAGGAVWETPFLVSAVGLFNTPNVPQIPGSDGFGGPQFHSAAWDHSVDLTGKRVAVVGNGASAVQFLPKIAPQAGSVTLFMRSPQYVLPRTTFPGTGAWDRRLQRFRGLRWLARLKIYLEFERFILRRLLFPDARLQGEAAFRSYLETAVPDPELRAKMTPDYPLGCKRLLVSDEWYDTLNRPNVDVVRTSIAAIGADGLRTEDGADYPADVLIYGTGFKPTEYLTPMRIEGRGGRALNDAWREGAEAYLGITISGFPNFFMMYGPNTNAIASIIFMLECQADYIVDCVRLLRRKRAKWLEIRADAQARFNEEMVRRLAKSVPAMAGCHTYFKMESGRITTQWPGYATEYRLRTRSVRTRDYVLA